MGTDVESRNTFKHNPESQSHIEPKTDARTELFGTTWFAISVAYMAFLLDPNTCVSPGMLAVSSAALYFSLTMSYHKIRESDIVMSLEDFATRERSLFFFKKSPTVYNLMF